MRASFPGGLTRLLSDPPPEFAFELSEAGIAFARVADVAQIGFRPLEPGAISVSPQRDNVLQPEQVTAALQAVSPGKDKRRRMAALILPDYAARVSVLEFDNFPTQPEEQAALVRFRMKKSVPFEVEHAAVSFHLQPAGQNEPKMEVVAVLAAQEIVAHFEAPLRAAGFWPGLVTTSGLAALDLVQTQGTQIVAKLSGRTLTVIVVRHGRVKLARCLELPFVSVEEVLGVLYPTLAYVEDALGTRPERFLVAGFGPELLQQGVDWQGELDAPLEPLQSRFGVPGANNAGLLGYLQGMVQ